MVDLGVWLRVMLHEWPMRRPLLSTQFRNTSALRLVIRSRRVSRSSRLLVICSLVRWQRRFLRSGIFVISSSIPIRYGSVACDVAIARVVVVMLVFGGQGSGTDGSELGVLHAFCFVFGFALPEALFAIAGGIVVGGAGTIAFFAPVGAGEEDFEGGADEEEEARGGVSRCSVLRLRKDMLTRR